MINAFNYINWLSSCSPWSESPLPLPREGPPGPGAAPTPFCPTRLGPWEVLRPPASPLTAAASLQAAVKISVETTGRPEAKAPPRIVGGSCWSPVVSRGETDVREEKKVGRQLDRCTSVHLCTQFVSTDFNHNNRYKGLFVITFRGERKKSAAGDEEKVEAEAASWASFLQCSDHGNIQAWTYFELY